MNIRKLVVATAATFAIVAGSITLPSIASAAPTAPLTPYALDVNNAKAASVVTGYYKYNGLTYFVATTAQYGRAIFSVSSNSAEAPKMVAHFETGDSMGNTDHLFGSGNYLFFTDTRESNGEWAPPYVVNLTTNEITRLQVDGQNVQAQYYGTSFAAVGNKVYFFGTTSNYGNALFYFDTSDASTGYVNSMSSVGSAFSGGATPEKAEEWGSPTLVALGTQLFIRTNSARILQYDTVNNVWAPNLTTNGSTEVTAGSLWGLYDYQGVTGLIYSNSINGTYNNHRFYFLKPNGTIVNLSTFVDTDMVNAAFINFNGKLYFTDAPVQGGTSYLYEISQVDGSRNSINSTVFPGSTSVTITNMTVIDGQLVMIGHTDLNAKDHIYKWSGTGAAVQVGDLGGTADGFFSYPTNGSSYVNYYGIGSVGNQLLVSLYRDPKVGFAPYRVDLNGNATLIRAFNQQSEGSVPTMYCSNSDANNDYILGSIINDTSSYAKTSLTVASESNGKLKYQTYILDGVSKGTLCNFTKIGNSVYFVGAESGYRNDYGLVYHLYKLDADGTLTHNGNFTGWPENTFTDGTYLYYVGVNNDAPYGPQLFQVNPATGESVMLTGTDASGIKDVYGSDAIWGNATPPQIVGNKIYFNATEIETDSQRPYVATIANDGTVSISKLKVSAFGDSYSFVGQYSRMYNFDGQIVYVTGNRSQNYYTVDPVTDELSLLAKPVVRGGGGITQGFLQKINGTIYSLESMWNNRIKAVDSEGGLSYVDVGFEPTRLATLGSYLVAVDDSQDVALFDGTTVTRADGTFGNNGAENIGYNGLVSPRGIYVSQYEYTKFVPWSNYTTASTEPVYYGRLIPQATARLGAPVVEAPAKPLGTLPAFDVTAPNAPTNVKATIGASVVNLTWNAPATGSAVDGYSVTSSPAGGNCEVTGTTAVCSGLTTGTRYTFTVKSINSAGLSGASAPSNQVVGPLLGSVPRLIGNVRVGKTVSINTGSWTPGVTFAYQWKRDNGNIPGATAATYVPVRADYGKKLSVAVTGKKAGFNNVTMTSNADSSSVVKNDTLVVTGKVQQGEKIVADQGSWDDGTVITYQWLSDGQPIDGATKSTYKVGPDDAGHRISVAVTGVLGSNTQTITSTPSAVVAFKKFRGIGRATMNTSLEVYDTACAYTTGTWDSNANFSYQWYRNGVAIDGETWNCYYGIGGDDVNAYFSAVVTASAPGYETVTRSTPRVRAVIKQFGYLDKPQLIGGSTIGSNLTFDLGNVNWWWGWTNISYQWLRNGVPIDGATGDNYTLTSADKYKRVVVRVTVAYPGYATRVLFSTTTDLITK